MLSICFSQHTSRIQIVAKYEMNMAWISPTLIDSMFFSYDSFNFAGFSDIATDCFDVEHDVIEPPVPLGNWCRLTFPHDDTNPGDCWENDFNVNNFTQDIRYKNDYYLESNYYEWDMEFNSYLAPGRVKLFLINNDLWANCLFKFEHNGEIFNYSMEDTLVFWNYYPGFSTSNEIKFSMGECSELAIKNNNLSKESKISIYPNPFNSSTQINYFSDYNSKTLINIYNLKGKKVWSQNIYSNAGFNSYKYQSPSNLSSGIYILNIKSNDLNISEYLINLK